MFVFSNLKTCLKYSQRHMGITRERKNKTETCRINIKPEYNWSSIAHLSAGDMLKSAVIEEKKFKHSPWEGADNPLRSKY